MLSSLLKNYSVKAVRQVVIVFLAVVLIPLIWPVGKKVQLLGSDYFPVSKVASSYRFGYARIDHDIQEMVQFIQSNTSENDAIYVGVKNHDQFIINDVIIYFLADRQYATKYHELHPGVTNTLDVQKEMIQELEENAVKLIVLTQRYWKEPNDTVVDAKLNYLDDYIYQNYELSEKFGAYEIWMQKS